MVSMRPNHLNNGLFENRTPGFTSATVYGSRALKSLDSRIDHSDVSADAHLAVPSDSPSVHTTSTDGDDHDLARRLVAGDESVLKEIMARYSHWIKARLKKMASGLTHDDLDDVLHDALWLLWKNAHRYDVTKSSVKTYFFTIARNKAIDLVRHLTAYNNVKTRYGKERWGVVYASNSSCRDTPWGGGPDQRLETQEDLAALERVLATLEELDRVILLASVDGGRWAIRLSKELGIATNILHYRKLRVLRRVRKMMQDQHLGDN